MKERFRQGHFSEIDKEWPPSTGALIEHVSRGTYNKALKFWESFGLPLPTTQDTDLGKFYDPVVLQLFTDIFWFKRYGVEWRVERKRSAIDKPRLSYKGIAIPKSLREALSLYVSRSPGGERSPVPDFMELATRLGHESFPIDQGKDCFGLTAIEDGYQDWYHELWNTWFSRPPRFGGWEIEAERVDKPNTEFRFRFSPSHHLRRLEVVTKLPRVLGDRDLYLFSKASFRGRQLISFWQEAPNGMFFQDPRGEKENIWPRWVRGWYEWWDLEKNKPPATQKDWDLYLNRVRTKQPVVSGKTGSYVLQTERQAKENLERWRNYIYNKSVQVFRFSRALDGTFKSEMGYVASGKFGLYVSKNPLTHTDLSIEETIKKLEGWTPATAISLIENVVEAAAQNNY